MRPHTPLAVENSVGKLAAIQGAQCQPGKESVANSHPPCYERISDSAIFTVLKMAYSKEILRKMAYRA
jgi:hypothetical protein